MNTSGRNRVVRVRSFAICQSHKAPLSLPTLLCATLSEGATGCRKQTCDGPSFTWTADRSILELTRSFVRFGLLWARLDKITRFSIVSGQRRCNHTQEAQSLFVPNFHAHPHFRILLRSRNPKQLSPVRTSSTRLAIFSDQFKRFYGQLPIINPTICASNFKMLLKSISSLSPQVLHWNVKNHSACSFSPHTISHIVTRNSKKKVL